ncbi:MAG: hypothetical protein QY306_05950 [Anaerolineales bacterium]|nr:MAG: hypothetical protein QY306_05950 [Anaerolineales bacterium]
MKVDELIARLSELPPDADVVVKGYEGGVDDVVDISLVTIRRDVNVEWFYGKHELDDNSDNQAIFLAGPNREPGNVN